MSAINRRQMLGLMGGAAVVGLGAGSLGVTPVQAASMPVETTPFSWTPRILDPKEVQPIAYEGFYDRGFGCGYGVFYSIIGTMGKKWGAPYNSFPYSMLEMGKSGVSEWGTLCGALLGAVSAFSLFWGRKDRDPMVDELFRWYETAAFPMYTPPKNAKAAKLNEISLPTSVADSVLCHISVSRWSYKNGIPAQSKERSERCARITADTAKKAVEIMNAKINGTFKTTLAASDVRKSCVAEGCHGGTADKYASPTLKGKMDCTPCHTGSEHVQNKMVDHP
ncbi:C-GCAxxG-C-C family protein [Desulfovibrio sp. OttesenSCG-928-F07]|nr:C-GCAxxG-C-C family protein [Desulfovibrio sp. OttesenSCG-928-F07]